MYCFRATSRCWRMDNVACWSNNPLETINAPCHNFCDIWNNYHIPDPRLFPQAEICKREGESELCSSFSWNIRRLDSLWGSWYNPRPNSYRTIISPYRCMERDRD
ncbi:104aa long hypothetical protein [Pyrococcus horikoshii OT3]|uniref:Uncharacterized protein n=1 Tax=Pyrococcus horikoshii (strain ATCC 700860 / DSM 12428 / JCM 9974 / NBRC 100139 / OT-3) TaxID=70601 RepID=O59277_PYRHO|nr:104aa long hypothetical protein [Pyrococcus horikoshii OT3]